MTRLCTHRTLPTIRGLHSVADFKSKEKLLSIMRWPKLWGKQTLHWTLDCNSFELIFTETFRRQFQKTKNFQIWWRRIIVYNEVVRLKWPCSLLLYILGRFLWLAALLHLPLQHHYTRALCTRTQNEMRTVKLIACPYVSSLKLFCDMTQNNRHVTFPRNLLPPSSGMGILFWTWKQQFPPKRRSG